MALSSPPYPVTEVPVPSEQSAEQGAALDSAPLTQAFGATVSTDPEAGLKTAIANLSPPSPLSQQIDKNGALGALGFTASIFALIAAFRSGGINGVVQQVVQGGGGSGQWTSGTGWPTGVAPLGSFYYNEANIPGQTFWFSGPMGWISIPTQGYPALTSGNTTPSGGSVGDIYFQLVSTSSVPGNNGKVQSLWYNAPPIGTWTLIASFALPSAPPAGIVSMFTTNLPSLTPPTIYQDVNFSGGAFVSGVRATPANAGIDYLEFGAVGILPVGSNFTVQAQSSSDGTTWADITGASVTISRGTPHATVRGNFFVPQDSYVQCVAHLDVTTSNGFSVQAYLCSS